MPLLHAEFGLSAANVIDSQLAFMLHLLHSLKQKRVPAATSCCLQDLPLLRSEFGLSAANVIDSQLAFMLLEAVQQQQGLHVRGRPQLRRRLEVLLAAYGLAHPNKMEVVAMTKSTPM